MKIYLDVCCLNRPFDELASDRIILEADAVLIVIKHCVSGEWELLGSSVIDYEIEQIPDPIKKDRVKKIASEATTIVEMGMDIENRARELVKDGFEPFDALHIASGEKGKADIFLTTDDNIIKKANKMRDCRISVKNPLQWIMEAGYGKHK
jgi:hypothetical protein